MGVDEVKSGTDLNYKSRAEKLTDDQRECVYNSLGGLEQKAVDKEFSNMIQGRDYLDLGIRLYGPNRDPEGRSKLKYAAYLVLVEQGKIEPKI